MVTLEQVNHFVLRKQHLTDDSRTDDILQITNDIAGLHGTGAKEPYLALFARTKNFHKKQLAEEMHLKRALGRVRCMRGTLYILTRELIPVAHAATRSMFEKLSRRYAEFRGISAEQYTSLSSSILKLLGGREMSVAQIKQKLGTEAHLSAVLNLMCDQGRLARVQSGDPWQSRGYKYALFQEYYQGIDLNQYSEAEGTLLLLSKYLSAFAPATLDDTAWWTGLGKTRVREALKSVKDLSHLEIEGLEGEFLVLKPELAELVKTSSFGKPQISLLPNLDPYVMGYKKRERFLDAELFDTVVDRSGNVTSTILLNGRIIGVWDFASVMKIYLLRRVNREILSQIHAKVAELGRFIAEKDVAIKSVSAMTPLKQRPAGAFMSPLKEG